MATVSNGVSNAARALTRVTTLAVSVSTAKDPSAMLGLLLTQQALGDLVNGMGTDTESPPPRLHSEGLDDRA